MSRVIHARLDDETEALRLALKQSTGWADSEIVRTGILGSLNNNYPLWNADPSRPAALRKGLHATSMRPFARLAGRAPRRPKIDSYY